MRLSLLRDNMVHQCYSLNLKSQLLKCYAFSQYLTYRSLCVSGFHRNEDMKAIDVLPILKEKVAFLSGQTLTLSTDIKIMLCHVIMMLSNVVVLRLMLCSLWMMTWCGRIWNLMRGCNYLPFLWYHQLSIICGSFLFEFHCQYFELSTWSNYQSKHRQTYPSWQHYILIVFFRKMELLVIIFHIASVIQC